METESSDDILAALAQLQSNPPIVCDLVNITSGNVRPYQLCFLAIDPFKYMYMYVKQQFEAKVLKSKSLCLPMERGLIITQTTGLILSKWSMTSNLHMCEFKINGKVYAIKMNIYSANCGEEINFRPASGNKRLTSQRWCCDSHCCYQNKQKT